MKIHKDFREFLERFNANSVDYVVIGAHALAYWGKPRYTGDMDVLVRPSQDNAIRVARAVSDFGFGMTYSASDFSVPGYYVQLGIDPIRIDISTGISGVTFDQVWANRKPGTMDEIPVFFIGKEEFITNKIASGRPKDLSDLALLQS